VTGASVVLVVERGSGVGVACVGTMTSFHSSALTGRVRGSGTRAGSTPRSGSPGSSPDDGYTVQPVQ
ncbi:hypothetical protein, partial [Streptomyces sp. SID12501]|uniref:hypothetical protein n=1 Tax=Streptomyces sp. SID12501 TaxID=2706042 RepID=UPI001941BD89